MGRCQSSRAVRTSSRSHRFLGHTHPTAQAHSFGGRRPRLVAGQRYADDPAVVHHVTVDEPLSLEDGLAAVDPDRLGDQHEAVSGPHLAAEAHVFQTTEADEVDLVELDVVTI